MITPESQPQEILLSLTKEELVSWILYRFPFYTAEYAKDAYWHTLDIRFDKADKRIGELLDQVRQTADCKETMMLFDEIDRLQKKTEAILRKKGIWGSYAGR